MTNIGISLGAVLAGWVVQVGAHSAYQLMIVANAVSFAASALIVLRLRPVEPGPAAGGPRWMAMRDRPYLALTALDGVTAVQFKVLPVAVPLWLIAATEAPHWLISGTMLLNTVVVVTCQMRAGRSIDTPVAGARAYRRSGFAFLLACVLISLTQGIPGRAAAALLPAGVAVHPIGELWHAAAGFEISFALAPERATGQYLGVFGLGAALAEAAGPALIIFLCITWGRPGWYVLGALFALTGLAAPLLVRWAERHRPAGQPQFVGEEAPSSATA
ncbi:MFS transporter [Streptomyces roseus]|uniref:hypothetical protein n=1 Tax=Streptomyces roseus TaxID=66430 RepID=UPI00069D4802|nr:hypothetical protein [Streptomyces roseus]